MGIHPSKEAFTIQSPNSMMAGKSETVDYGSLLPQGLYSSACVDYDYKVVRRFIREGRLAPFYKGLNELPEPSISDHNQAPSMCVPISTKTVSTPDHCTTTTTTPTATTVTTHCPTVKKQAVRFPSRPSLRPSKSPSDLNALLYTDTVECPICFLIYPAFINYSRCCDKPICTECFLQLRRSPESPLIPAVCPFCVQPNFGVVHVPPVWSIHYENLSKRRLDLIRTVSANDTSTTSTRRKRLGPNDPDVVLVGKYFEQPMNLKAGNSCG
ncbi:uncharacterized protein BYT42DRAFT_350772 [Radiomyces spectabilis]|uniref:uncharacterized protein n=1 Tax=Radiomyces spectabilis TaxID=64574 RepID=UPI00221F4BAA|nr:uncharacterized protein BYT42DRAFT_350772 [Radiomyces spectabilis]KAI8377622.1 hypothetical protein BYT42DRAFT_350772 [Radiomyces spectabilis]